MKLLYFLPFLGLLVLAVPACKRDSDPAQGNRSGASGPLDGNSSRAGTVASRSNLSGPGPANNASDAPSPKGAEQALKAAMSGSQVRAADYGTTEDEIFDLFDQRYLDLSRLLERPGGLKAHTAASLDHLRAMERVNPDHRSTLAFRQLCRLNGVLPP